MEVKIGEVTHYYNRIGVAVLSLSAEINIGELIHILGHTTDFEQTVASLEIDHHKVLQVGPGMEVALRVEEPVRRGDAVYRTVEIERDYAG